MPVVLCSASHGSERTLSARLLTDSHYSGTAEGSIAPAPFRCRFGKGGKLRLIVERACEDIQQRRERRVVAAFHCGTQGFLDSMIARNELGIGTPHRLRALQR